MSEKLYKNVMMLIRVPNSDYCWNKYVPCQYFNNEVGHGYCELDFYPVKRDENGRYPKPKACLKLIEYENND